MRQLLSFRGEISRWPYLAAVAGVFFSQHAVAAAISAWAGQKVIGDAEFWLLPLRGVARLNGVPSGLLVACLAVSLGAALGLAVLSFRRALSSGHQMVWAALSVVPVLQIPAVLVLGLGPVRSPPRAQTSADPLTERPWAPATQGALAGMGLAVLAVAVSALVFRSYGYGLFVGSPFLIGVTTGYLANRGAALTRAHTTKIVIVAALLGGAALIAFALEGAICILLAGPLGLGFAAIGGLLGREFAVAGRRRARPTLVSAAVLPLLFACDLLLPPVTDINTSQSVEIAAPPPAVWRALTSAAPIAPRPPWPLRLGIAYPLRAEIVGAGVGGERRGYFSTGVARERITAWDENRRLAFTVLDDPPVMREFSPYAHVHAPHVVGYFHTIETRFELTPLAGGRTRLVERTSHELRLDPVLYWLPMARIVIDQNNGRVLANLRRTAEREAAAVATVASPPPSPQSRTAFRRFG